MTTSTDFKHLCPFLGLPWQKKTFTAMLIRTPVTNVLFPILLLSEHMARLYSLVSYGWLGSYYHFWTRSWEWKWCVSLSGLGLKHLIATVRPSKALSSLWHDNWLYHLLELPNWLWWAKLFLPIPDYHEIWERNKSFFLSHYSWGLFVTGPWYNLSGIIQAQSRELQHKEIWISPLIPKKLWMF